MICVAHLILYQVSKYKSMRWVGHVACMGTREMHTGFWLRNLKKDPPWETQTQMAEEY